MEDTEVSSGKYAGPLNMILDDEPFQLSYMSYDSSMYSQFYKEKAESFLHKLFDYGESIKHDFQLTPESIILEPSQPNYGLPANMTALCSPPRHCRERVRFPIYRRSEFNEVEASFPDKVEQFWQGRSNCADKEEELVYTMWEVDGGCAMVHVS